MRILARRSVRMGTRSATHAATVSKQAQWLLRTKRAELRRQNNALFALVLGGWNNAFSAAAGGRCPLRSRSLAYQKRGRINSMIVVFSRTYKIPSGGKSLGEFLGEFSDLARSLIGCVNKDHFERWGPRKVVISAISCGEWLLGDEYPQEPHKWDGRHFKVLVSFKVLSDELLSRYVAAFGHSDIYQIADFGVFEDWSDGAY